MATKLGYPVRLYPDNTTLGDSASKARVGGSVCDVILKATN